MPTVGIAVMAVVAGEGLADVFKNLGVSAIIPGGQTMNPSTRDILQAVESVPSDKVIILPNNKNIVPTAQQVESLTNKSINVVPTETIPQGLTALLAFDPEADFQTNIQLMAEAKSGVKTIEITRATRSTRLNGLDIKRNQAIGLLDDELLAASDDIITVISDLLARIDVNKTDVITILYGADTEEAEAEQVKATICQQYPALQVEVINGGQPHYNYIISVE